MIATTATASIRTFLTLPIDVSMKFACRKTMLSILMPFGMVRLSSAMARSTSADNFTVSMAGCFSTEMMTAGRPMKPASPRFSRAP